MFSLSSWLHLRIHFSIFLLPIFLFSLSISPNFNGPRIFWVFFIIHFLLYPASNAYNSYFDKDEKSIGGLENPPPVRKGLYFLALTLDLIAIDNLPSLLPRAANAVLIRSRFGGGASTSEVEPIADLLASRGR